MFWERRFPSHLSVFKRGYLELGARIFCKKQLSCQLNMHFWPNPPYRLVTKHAFLQGFQFSSIWEFKRDISAMELCNLFWHLKYPDYSYAFFLPSFTAGVAGVMDAYNLSLATVQLYGPTFFSPVISNVARQAQSSSTNHANKYHILLIVTDGVITDIDKTKVGRGCSLSKVFC